MAIVYKGNMSFAAGGTFPQGAVSPLCPLLARACGNAAISIAAAYQGALDLNASISITPPSIAALISALAEFEAQCSFAITAGVPTVSFDTSGIAQILVDLNASLTALIALDAQLELPAAVAWLGYPYPAPGTGLGAACTPLSTVTNALILAAVDIPFFTSGVAKAQLEALLDGVTYPGAGAFVQIKDISATAKAAIPQASAAIQHQIDLALKLRPAVSPPTFAASAQAAAKLAAYLSTDAGAVLPKVGFTLAASAKLAASLLAQFNALIQLGLAIYRPDGGLYVYSYTDTGTPGGLATELTAALASVWGDGVTPTALPCEAAVLGTVDPVSWANLTGASGFFAGAA